MNITQHFLEILGPVGLSLLKASDFLAHRPVLQLGSIEEFLIFLQLQAQSILFFRDLLINFFQFGLLGKLERLHLSA